MNNNITYVSPRFRALHGRGSSRRLRAPVPMMGAVLSALMIGATLAPSQVQAVTYYWDPQGTTALGGPGTWDTVTANWSAANAATASTVPYGNGTADGADFGGPNPATNATAPVVTLANNTTINANTIVFELTGGVAVAGAAANVAVGYTVAGGTGSLLNFTGTTPTVTYNNGAQETISAASTGTAGLTITNGAASVLTDTTGGNGTTNPFRLTGDLSGLSGTVNIGTGSTTAGGAYVVVGAGSTNFTSGANQIWSVNAGALLTTNNVNAGAIYSFGALSGSGVIRSGASAGVSTRTGTDTLRVGDLNLSTTFSGTIVARGNSNAGLNKVGTGTLTLSGANTYTGPTVVNGGTLSITGSTAAASAFTVNNGAVLSGSGTVAGTVNVTNGGTLSAGTRGAATPAVGTLTTGALTLATGSTFDALLSSNTSFSTLTATGTTALGNAAFTIGLTSGATFTDGQVLRLITSTVSGQFTNSVFTTGGYNFTADYLTNANNFDVRVTAVPEPTTLVGGLLLVGLCGAYQRRRITSLLSVVRG